MKILHTVEFYRPSVGGAQEVVRQLSERLAARGHDVTVATTKLAERSFSEIAGVKIVEFDLSGNEVRGYRGDVRTYHDFLRRGEFDVMMNYAAQQWTADAAYPVLHELPYAKVFSPCGFSGLPWKEYQGYFQRMPAVLRRYDRLIFHSGRYRDIEFAQRHAVPNIRIIPNGCGRDEFTSQPPSFRKQFGIPDDVPLLLTVGSHTGAKGHAETIDAFRRAKIGRAVLVVVGNCLWSLGCLPKCRAKAGLTKLLSLGRKKVMLLDIPREQTVAAFQAADLFVFPSNIECSPLVLFEAMASRTPFVATPAGNSAEIAEWGQGGVIVKSTVRRQDGFVVADRDSLKSTIEELILDAPRRAQMAERGYAAWEERFTWEKLVVEYERAYEEAIDRHRNHRLAS